MPHDDEDLPPGIIRSRPRTEQGVGPLPPTPSPADGGRGVRPGLHDAVPTPLASGREAAFEPRCACGGKGPGDRGPTQTGGEVGPGSDPLSDALEDAYKLLTYRDRSEKDLTDRLLRKGHSEETIADAIARLRGVGFVDDAAFARRWVENRGQTRGQRALSQELRLKGIGRDLAAETLSEAREGDTERAAARLAAVRRLGERPADTSREAKARLAGFLQRRGFSWDVVRPVLAELFGAREDEEGTPDGGPDEGEIDPETT